MPPPLYFLCGDVMKKGIKKRLAAVLLSVLVLVALFEYVCIHSAVAASGIAIIGLTTAIGLISVYLGYVGSCNENGWTDQTIIDTWKESWLGSGQMFDDWAVGWDEIKDSYKQAFLNEVWGDTYKPEDLASYDYIQTIQNIVFPDSTFYNYDGVIYIAGSHSYIDFAFVSNDITPYIAFDWTSSNPCFLFRVNDVYYYQEYNSNNNSWSNYNTNTFRSALGYTTNYWQRFPVNLNNGFWVSYPELWANITRSNVETVFNDLGVTKIYDSLDSAHNDILQHFQNDLFVPLTSGGGEYAPKFAYPAAQDLANNEDYLGGIRLDGLPSEQDLMNGVNAVGASSADDFLVGLHSGVYGPSDVYTAMQASGVTPYVLTDAGTGEIIGVGENAGSVAAGQEGVKPVALDSSLALPTAAQALAAPEYQPQNWDLVNPGQFQFPLFDFFPWCIPKDLYLLLSLFLVAEPVTPVFTIPFPVSENQTQDITFDFSDYDEIARVGRNIFIVFFIAGLIITIKNRMF